MGEPYSDISLLTIKNCTVGYSLKQNKNLEVLANLNLSVQPGELITFIGPNGCGKSTLIKSLVGLIPKLKGELYFKNENLELTSFSERAERIGVVLTEPVYERNMTVKELVSMGRYTHTNWLGSLSKLDRAIVDESITKVGLRVKINSRLAELSDGERQRAMIARVLSQDVDLIILDEPTAHLDLSNRMEVLLLLKSLAHEFGKGILLSTHELGLALQVSDRIWMVNNQQQVISDIPEELIRTGWLDRVFGNEKISFHPWSASFEVSSKTSIKAFVRGIGILQACVVRLLKRMGVKVIYESADQKITIDVYEQDQKIVVDNGSKKEIHTLHELQSYITKLLQEA